MVSFPGGSMARRTWPAAAAALLLATASPAQETTATITGTVSDQTGAVLPGVAVVAMLRVISSGETPKSNGIHAAGMGVTLCGSRGA